MTRANAFQWLRAMCFAGVAAIALALPAPARGESREAAHGCLAQTLYWEAKSEGRKGMEAVGWVVLNRMRDGEFPRTICAVVKQGQEKPGCQFSYWCDGKSDTPEPDDEWALAQDVARDLLSDPPPDPTGGAMFYHTVEVKAPWAESRKKTGRIGRHIYYR
jgi:spore germination cell wall hydrolase CwlJ-like protein